MKRCLQHYVMAAALLGTAAAAAAQPAPAAAEATERFEIRRFVVAGNTLLTEDQVQAAVAPFTGQGRVYGDTPAAAADVSRMDGLVEEVLA